LVIKKEVVKVSNWFGSINIALLYFLSIAELEPEEKNMVFKMIDTFLIKKKFKDFFAKNIAAL